MRGRVGRDGRLEVLARAHSGGLEVRISSIALEPGPRLVKVRVGVGVGVGVGLGVRFFWNFFPDERTIAEKTNNEQTKDCWKNERANETLPKKRCLCIRT